MGSEFDQLRGEQPKTFHLSNVRPHESNNPVHADGSRFGPSSRTMQSFVEMCQLHAMLHWQELLVTTRHAWLANELVLDALAHSKDCDYAGSERVSSAASSANACKCLQTTCTTNACSTPRLWWFVL